MPVDSLEPRKIPDISPEVLILSEKELFRLRDASEKHEQPKPSGREGIRESSKKLSSGWKNTIAGLTRERLKEAKDREDAIEIERQKMDDIEGEFQELRRRYVLDVAQRRRYEEQDRVKRLLAAKRFVESVEGRESQKETRDRASHGFDEYDSAFDRAILADVEKHLEEEEEKAEKSYQVNKAFAGQLQRQLRAHQAKEDHEKYEERQTTLLLQDLADTYNENENREAYQDRQKKRDYFNELNAEKSRNRQIGNVLEKMDKAENERIKLFNDAKLKMKKMHIERQEKLQKEKEEQQNKISNKLKDASARYRKKEEKILKKALQERDEKEKMAEQEKKTKRLGILKEIDLFTQQAKANKEKAQQDYKAMRLNEGIQLRDLYEKLTEKELNQSSVRQESVMQSRHIMQHQIAKKKNEKSRKVQEELDEYSRHMTGLYQEEETFQKFAKQLIEDCDAQGLDTHPLKLAAAPGIECGKGPVRTERGSIRPKYLASVSDPDELHYVPPTRTKASFDETKQRLGFCN